MISPQWVNGMDGFPQGGMRKSEGRKGHKGLKEDAEMNMEGVWVFK